jgi:hypothetical protein
MPRIPSVILLFKVFFKVSNWETISEIPLLKELKFISPTVTFYIISDTVWIVLPNLFTRSAIASI